MKKVNIVIITDEKQSYTYISELVNGYYDLASHSHLLFHETQGEHRLLIMDDLEYLP